MLGTYKRLLSPPESTVAALEALGAFFFYLAVKKILAEM